MTTEEALNIIDQAVSQINTNRAGHVQLQTAINTISSALSSYRAKEMEANDTVVD